MSLLIGTQGEIHIPAGGDRGEIRLSFPRLPGESDEAFAERLSAYHVAALRAMVQCGPHAARTQDTSTTSIEAAGS